MTKYIAILCAFLAVCVGLALWRVDVLTKQNARLETEKKACLDEKESYKNAQISASIKIKKLRQKALADKPVVDCYNSPMPKFVVDELSKLK